MSNPIRYTRIKNAVAPVPFEHDEVNGLWHIYVTDGACSVAWLDETDAIRVERFGNIHHARAFAREIK